MKKVIGFFVLLVLAGSVFAQDVWVPGYVWNAAANTGEDVWFGPGNKVTTNGAFARGANVMASGTGYNIVETGSVALRDGRAVTLTASRFASATAMAAATARLAAGPVGIVAVLAIPAVYDWITAEGGQKIRVNSSRSGVEIKDDPTFSYVSTVGTISSPPMSLVASQVWVKDHINATRSPSNFVLQNQTTTTFQVFSNTAWQTYYGSTAQVEQSGDWLPASMDDISPYMTPRLPPQSYPKDIVNAGGDIDLTPVSITGPSPALPQKSPSVTTTTYPKPSDKTTSQTVPGNPFGLAPNTPTVTGSSTGSAPLNPGSTTTTGPTPTGTPVGSPGPVTTPTTTTTTSTHNPTTNQTTSTTTTTQDGASKTSSTQSTTNITNTTNTSIFNTTNITTTTITNTTTNTPLEPVKVDTTPATEPPKTQCEINPDSVGCAKMDVPTDKVPEKTITITWVEENLGLGAGSCPPPIGFNTSLGSYALNLGQYCDFVTTYVRPLVLLFSLLAAFFIVAPIRQD